MTGAYSAEQTGTASGTGSGNSVPPAAPAGDLPPALPSGGDDTISGGSGNTAADVPFPQGPDAPIELPGGGVQQPPSSGQGTLPDDIGDFEVGDGDDFLDTSDGGISGYNPGSDVGDSIDLGGSADLGGSVDLPVPDAPNTNLDWVKGLEELNDEANKMFPPGDAPAPVPVNPQAPVDVGNAGDNGLVDDGGGWGIDAGDAGMGLVAAAGSLLAFMDLYNKIVQLNKQLNLLALIGLDLDTALNKLQEYEKRSRGIFMAACESDCMSNPPAECAAVAKDTIAGACKRWCSAHFATGNVNECVKCKSNSYFCRHFRDVLEYAKDVFQSGKITEQDLFPQDPNQHFLCPNQGFRMPPFPLMMCINVPCTVPEDQGDGLYEEDVYTQYEYGNFNNFCALKKLKFGRLVAGCMLGESRPGYMEYLRQKEMTEGFKDGLGDAIGHGIVNGAAGAAGAVGGMMGWQPATPPPPPSTKVGQLCEQKSLLFGPPYMLRPTPMTCTCQVNNNGGGADGAEKPQ